MAAKRTSEPIPLCHPLPLTAIDVSLTIVGAGVEIEATAETTAQTGVEMEALTAASVAALTVYDMVKAVDKSAVIESIRLLTKSGGKSGAYEAPESAPPDKAGSSAKPQRTAKATPRVLMSEAGAARP